VARLARWLRLMGADVICEKTLGGSAILKLAREQHRVVLTRDKRLKTAPEVLFIESNDFREQLRQVLARFPFDPRRDAFTRCVICNRPLVTVPREVVSRRVPPFVFASFDKFAECDRCGRIYWAATHPERVMRELEALGIPPPANRAP